MSGAARAPSTNLLEAVVLEVLKAEYIEDADLNRAAQLCVCQRLVLGRQQRVGAGHNPREQPAVDGLGHGVAVVLRLRHWRPGQSSVMQGATRTGVVRLQHFAAHEHGCGHERKGKLLLVHPQQIRNCKPASQCDKHRALIALRGRSPRSLWRVAVSESSIVNSMLPMCSRQASRSCISRISCSELSGRATAHAAAPHRRTPRSSCR